MSDFTSGFWNIYVIGLTILSIVGCAWLLVSTGRIKVASKKDGTAAGGTAEVGVTGHVWDGDLQEYNNPLPKWWSNLFWITIVFGVVYLDPLSGPRHVSRRARLVVQRRVRRRSARKSTHRLKPLYDEVREDGRRSRSPPTPPARQTGERMFLTYCSPCHGSDAGGSKGFPNLRDEDWLYGGTPETIVTTITGGTDGRDAGVRSGAGRGRRPQRDCVRPVAVGASARQPEGTARQDGLRDELRGLPRRGRQGQPGARRAQPDRQRLAVRQFRDRRWPRASPTDAT